MSITVQDCLNLPSLSQSKLIAGAGGLHKIVSSISVVEFWDSNKYNDFSPNELLISAFYAFKDDEDYQCKVLKSLSETGAVALVLFYVDSILGEVSTNLKSLSDSINFPLIIIDSSNINIKYSDIIFDVTDAIITDKSMPGDFVESTINRLRQVPEEHRTMDTLLAIVSEYHKCSLILSDDNILPLASSFWPSQNRFSPTPILEAFKYEKDELSIKECSIHNTNFNVVRILFQLEDSSYLSLFIVMYKNLLTQQDLRNICKCVGLYSSLWGYTLDTKSSESIISLLLKGPTNVVNNFLSRSKISFNSISRMLIITSPKESIIKVKDATAAFMKENNINNITAVLGKYIICLVNPKSFNSIEVSPTALLSTHLKEFATVHIFDDGGSLSFLSMRENYTDFCKNAHILSKIFNTSTIWSTSDLSFALELSELNTLDNKKKKNLTEIIDVLEKDSNNLLETLSTYLIDCNSHLNNCSKALFVHRNTISYRLNRIKMLTGIDFARFPASYDFYLASALWKLQNR
ncbi:MAG: PucR family transcriptional regulator [Anaerovoracaceae bacterium]